MPRPIEHRQQKFVQNGAITTGTRHNHRQFAFTPLIKFDGQLQQHPNPQTRTRTTGPNVEALQVKSVDDRLQLATRPGWLILNLTPPPLPSEPRLLGHARRRPPAYKRRNEEAKRRGHSA